MKDKIKGFFIEKKELLIFIGVVVVVFLAVITVASIAINRNTPVSDDDLDITSVPSTSQPTTTPTQSTTIEPIILRFSLPVSGEYNKVRTFFDPELKTEELVSAVIDTGSKIITSTGISYSKSDNTSFSVLAIYNGEVVDVTSDELKGSSVTIKHSNDIISVYSSLTDVCVSVGDIVEQGNKIASASTSTNDVKAGVHVYLQIKINDKYVNPDAVFGLELEDVSAEK